MTDPREIVAAARDRLDWLRDEYGLDDIDFVTFAPAIDLLGELLGEQSQAVRVPLFLAPHADDETLFAAYTLQRERPYVVFCFSGADDAVRQTEARDALEQLGLDPERSDFWQFPEATYRVDPNRRDLLSQLRTSLLETLRAARQDFDRVYAPAVEEGGHPDHNLIGELALEVWGPAATFYLTYTRDGRSTSGVPVEATREEQQTRKLRAMACYRSQIERPATRPWFTTLLDMREWYAA